MQTDTDAPVYDQYWQADLRRADAHRLAHKYTSPIFPASLPKDDPRLPVGSGPAYAVIREKRWWPF